MGQWAFPSQPDRWDEMTPECQEAWDNAFNGGSRLPGVPLDTAPLDGGDGTSGGPSGGNYRAPAAQLPIGEAEHEPLSPPMTPSEGGGGGSVGTIVQATADGADGKLKVKSIQLKTDLAAHPNFAQTGDEFELSYYQL